MLIIELDGGQHSEQRNARRAAALEARGYKVLRFWNTHALTNLDGGIELVRIKLHRRAVR